MKWYLIKLDINSLPYERSQSFDSEPVLELGWDTVWSQTQWDAYIASIPVIPSVITKDEIHKLAENYQDLYYDSRGITFLLNVKQDLIKAYANTVDSVLAYQMIESASRWVNKVWANAFYYDTLAASGVQPDINFELDAGLPPCKFRDIMWVLDPAFQSLEPDRVVNLDINYYLNWT